VEEIYLKVLIKEHPDPKREPASDNDPIKASISTFTPV
jgi:hypothetical protein